MKMNEEAIHKLHYFPSPFYHRCRRVHQNANSVGASDLIVSETWMSLMRCLCD
jgi:hypothetical protein